MSQQRGEREQTGYDVEAEPFPRLQLPGGVSISLSLEDAIERLAQDLVIHADNCVREFGDFHLALSGDVACEPVYRRLMVDPAFRWLPWRRTHVWFTYEQCVSFEDDRSCFSVINGLIGDHADIPREQFHPIFPESGDTVDEYERQLRETLGWRERGQDRLDYVLLTARADGATAGLRATHAALDETALMQLGPGFEPGAPDLVSMTPGFMNAARFVSVLLPGAEDEFFDRLHRDRTGEGAMPINLIAPLRGELRWYVDASRVIE